MTRADFNHLLDTIKALPPEQIRQLRQQLDQQLAQPKPPTAAKSGKTAKRAKRVRPADELLSADDPRRAMMENGLILSLPDPALDIDDDDPDDAPVAIKGEPLSETILRERR
jgi:hypothetical protein